jgi:hypothetical protein
MLTLLEELVHGLAVEGEAGGGPGLLLDLVIEDYGFVHRDPVLVRVGHGVRVPRLSIELL